VVGQRPRVAVFSPDGRTLWVSSEIGGGVAIMDVATHKVLQTIHFEITGVPADKIQPVGIRLTADGKRAFVALGPANRVAVVDAQTFQVKSYILVGQRVWQMAFTPDGKQLYTTNGVSGDVTVIDVERLAAVRSIKVGRYPWGVAIRP
jgi:YVTN family beta-propeller protein